MHIRDVDDDIHAELVRRAEDAGMSLRAYVIDVLREHTSLPTLDDWLDQVRAEPPLPAEGPSSVELVAEGLHEVDGA